MRTPISISIITSALASVLTIGSGAFSAPAADPANGAVVEMPARYVFAPKGFDDNDEAVVTIDGYLPSGCYRLVRPEVNIDSVTKAVTIKPMARFFDVPCVEALVPYSVEVQLGVLSVGEYTIAAGVTPVGEELAVTEAINAGPDDYLYAPVDEVAILRDEATGTLTAELKGRFTNSCMTWDNVVVQDNGKTVNILPIILMAETDCTAGEAPFRKLVELPNTITAGRHLLHVRSLNGRAINFLFSVNP